MASAIPVPGQPGRLWIPGVGLVQQYVETMAAGAALPVENAMLGHFGQVTVTLARGSRGPAVKALQSILNTFGYGLTPDGIFGSVTEKAVKLVQAKLNRAVTGRWTPEDDVALKAINQSGIVDAGANEKAALLDAERKASMAAAAAGAAGATVEPAATQQESIDPYGSADQPFMEKLKVWMKNPWYWVGIGAVGIGLWWLWSSGSKPTATQQVAPVETLGLPAKAKRKRRRKAKKGDDS